MSNLISSRKRRANALGLGSCSLGNIPVTGYTVTVQPHCRKERRAAGKKRRSPTVLPRPAPKRRKVALTLAAPSRKRERIDTTRKTAGKKRRK